MQSEQVDKITDGPVGPIEAQGGLSGKCQVRRAIGRVGQSRIDNVEDRFHVTRTHRMQRFE